MLPASKWKLVRPIVEESTCDPLLSTTLSETEWSMVEEKMPHFFPPYLIPKGEWSTMLPLNHSQWEYQRYCRLCSKGATSGHMMTDVHNRNLNDWKRQGCPPVHIAADRFTDNQRLEMVLQAFLPSFTREQILVTKERVLQEEWYRSSGRYEGPIPDEEEEVEVMVVSSSAGPSSSAGLPLATLTRAGGTEEASEAASEAPAEEASEAASEAPAEEAPEKSPRGGRGGLCSWPTPPRGNASGRCSGAPPRPPRSAGLAGPSTAGGAGRVNSRESGLSSRFGMAA